jgi:pimeloyl-ACP methyl ester carboxylesterase
MPTPKEPPTVNILHLQNSTFRIACLDLAGTDPAAPPDLYLHGLGSSSIATFPAIATRPELRNHRAILLDLPGFGFSTAPGDWTFSIEDQTAIVIACIEHLHLSPVRLVGHSMGGSIAIALAHRRPDLVRTLIVAEPNLDPGSGTLSGHVTRQNEAAFVARGYDRLLLAMQRQAARGDQTAAIFAPTVKQASPLALHRAATSLRAARTPTFREMLLNAKMPRLVIAGAASGIPVSDFAGTGIHFIEIANAGHTMMDDDPAAFAAAIATLP